MQCVIGISLATDDRERWKPGRRYHYLDSAYARAVEEAGGIPLYLPLQGDAKRAVDQVDGLLLPGGDDLMPPAPYPPDVPFEPVPEEQLAFDRAVLRAAVDAGLPVLGICYGMQVIAIEAGGSLHYDIATDIPGAAPHSLGDPAGRHDLALEPGSRLERLLGPKPGAVNSQHHQAVAEPGPGLCVTARAPDSVIEAIEASGPGFVVGVQWHPERLDTPASRALFAGFVRACEKGPQR